MTARRGAWYLIAGLLWGGFGGLLSGRAFGRPVWGGVVAGPLIGLAVGAICQRRFEQTTGWRRAALALFTLYLSGTLFGLATGVARWQAQRPVGPRLGDTAMESVLTTWWGMTIAGYFLFLWPLSYGTHWLLEQATDR